ncbi:MAG: class I SAM-dependent methyltransferase [Bacteroidales bacterium]|jgi:predicted O-methyltransferase YrrM|nr:class I SAM-dependent methyltransferase [Bacteroidales bacterium]
MNFYAISRYLVYRTLSGHSRGHGIHSPFVFRLVSSVFRNKTAASIVCKVENARKRMLNDRRWIEVTDLGSGSGGRKYGRRRISDIARTSPVTARYGRLLSAMAAEFGNGYIVEMGTSAGISTMYMALCEKPCSILTIEGSEEIARVAAENFSNAGIANISIAAGSFEEYLPAALAKAVPGLVFIDGDHRPERLLAYFDLIAKEAGNETVVIIDDIHMNAEMGRAWKEIGMREDVTVTVDIFRMGLVFFRKEVTKGNYVVRY